jgi:hypothetical protein
LGNWATKTGPKESFAFIPAVRVAGEPEATQGLSRLQQTASAKYPRYPLKRGGVWPDWPAPRGSHSPQEPQVTQHRAVRELLWGEGAPVLRGSQVDLGVMRSTMCPSVCDLVAVRGKADIARAVAEMTRLTQSGPASSCDFPVLTAHYWMVLIRAGSQSRASSGMDFDQTPA